jgi:hypothetical protein
MISSMYRSCGSEVTHGPHGWRRDAGNDCYVAYCLGYDSMDFGVKAKAMRWGEKKPYQEPCRENTRENYEPTFILFNRNKGEKRQFSSVTFKSDYRERGSGSTDGDDFIAAYDKAIEMAEKRGYEKAKAEALEFITNSAKQYFKE